MRLVLFYVYIQLLQTLCITLVYDYDHLDVECDLEGSKIVVTQ